MWIIVNKIGEDVWKSALDWSDVILFTAVDSLPLRLFTFWFCWIHITLLNTIFLGISVIYWLCSKEPYKASCMSLIYKCKNFIGLFWKTEFRWPQRWVYFWRKIFDHKSNNVWQPCKTNCRVSNWLQMAGKSIFNIHVICFTNI